jgi:hypothetical protein
MCVDPESGRIHSSGLVGRWVTGGADAGNEEKLRMSLARSTWDMAKIGEDLFGLLEFYPHIKRGRKKKNGAS